ncbi:penicillin-binding protein 2 [Acidocella aminolytica]|uniref:penicillin-binding protein 2 n=1 Tax=Acidocella aminolytica TaxID=33998 RepID=UPI00069BB74B|nr:penicillin-binding protein 2 [Acidocella aminolytica]GBQ34409.1 cell division protein FtsI [Acidocella aminolytica 101 = DSM 11237]SHE30976.1 peptidoglycan glycosyltransferase [Acidocella aminolytica 101 = DSM 11237]
MKRKFLKDRLFTRRVSIIGGTQALVFAAITGRLYDLQVWQYPRYRKMARDNATLERLVPPERGLITDHAGVVLAGNVQRWRAMLLLSDWTDAPAILARFEKIISLSAADRTRLAKIFRGRRRYLPILLKNDLSWNEMAQLEVNRPWLPGVIINHGFERRYPLGKDTAHTVGYVVPPHAAAAKADPVLDLPGVRVGGAGVEQAHNQTLFGTPGVTELEVNDRGAVVRVLGRRAEMSGKTIALTLDAGLQREAMRILDGRPGALVMMDARNGAVRAMVSAPSFDQSYFDNGVPDHVWTRWMKDPQHPLVDRTTQGLYAPGSTFKPTVALAALRCEAITAKTKFFCSGHLKIGNRMFFCWLRSGHGWMDAASALQQSCDVFFYHVAMRVGIDKMAAMGNELGLVGAPAMDFPSLAGGFLPTCHWAHKRGLEWTEGRTAIQGIGQGYSVLTPLNLAIMVTRVATGRKIVPHLVGAIDNEPVKLRAGEELNLAEKHLAVVRQGMNEVVNTPLGTSWGGRLDVHGARMAGKTGTAQVISESAAMEAANYDDSKLPWKYRPNALFVGYAPLEKPAFAVSVVIEHGGLLDPVKAARDMFARALTSDKLQA